MGKWDFNGISLCTKAWYVEEVLDGIGPPGFRGENLQVPFQNGTRHVKKRYNKKNMILGMWVVGCDKVTGRVPDGMTMMESLEQNIEYLSSLFGIRGQHALKRTMYDDSVREAQAEVYGKVNFVSKPEGYCKFSVEFELADPFFYSLVLEEELRTINSMAATYSFNNPGNAPVTNAIITLTGPLDSPRIENLNNDIWIRYLGVLEAGETAVINTKDFTCLKGAENYIAAIKHGGDAYWLILEAGSNSLEITTQVTGGSIEIEYYPAYF